MRFFFIMILSCLLMSCHAGMRETSGPEADKAGIADAVSSRVNTDDEQPKKGSGDSVLNEEKAAAIDSVLLDDYSSDVEETDKKTDIEHELNATDTSPLSEAEEEALESDVGLLFDLDVHETKEMLQYFKYYTHKHRKTFARWLKRSEPYLPYIKKVLTEEGLPHELIFLPFAESGFNPWAYSHAGAAGLWQFIPGTGRRYGLTVNWWIDERRDPYMATRAAAKYLNKLYADFGDWYLALAGYNAGEGRVAWALRKSGYDSYFDLITSKHYLRRETRLYVPKLMAILKIIKNLESLGFEPLDWNNRLAVEKIRVDGGTDLLGLSSRMNISWKEFRKLNPAFRRQVSPPGRKSTVYVPEEKLRVAKAYVQDAASRPHSGYSRYKVRNGDSWWRISRLFGIPISVLKQVNNRRSDLLRPGQVLMVPNSSTKVASSKTRIRARERANYTVRKGDTLWGLAQRYGIGLRTLYKANGISNPRSLKPGQKLYIPDLGAAQATASAGQAEDVHRQLVRYKVRHGDNLWNIARRFGVRTIDLQKWNSISRGKLIHPGDKIKIYVE
ncbi:MAG: LysM peptidoglycan-binding domain-containing protein [Thermodesulfobacteriota bacterium]